MKEQIERLVELQKIDEQIFDLREEAAQKPLDIAELEENFKLKEEEVKQFEEEGKALLVFRKEKELDLEKQQEDIKKYEGQLYQIKTNKEYSALQLEIEKLRADSSSYEEEILKIMEETDNFGQESRQRKERLEEERGKLEEEKVSKNREAEVIKEKIAVLEIQRNEILPSVEAGILNKYERILSGRKGLAVVAVTNGVCGGCNMHIPIQRVNEISMAENIIYCENCARILYV